MRLSLAAGLLAIVLYGCYRAASFMSGQLAPSSAADAEIAEALRPAAASPDAPYLRGKVFVVDADARRREDLAGYGLDPASTALRLVDAGTIVRLQWGRELVGRYVDPDGAYAYDAFKRVCVVTLVDRKTGAAFPEKRFTGEAPPLKSIAKTQETGDFRMAMLTDYLNGLPRRVD